MKDCLMYISLVLASLLLAGFVYFGEPFLFTKACGFLCGLFMFFGGWFVSLEFTPKERY